MTQKKKPAKKAPAKKQAPKKQAAKKATEKKPVKKAVAKKAAPTSTPKRKPAASVVQTRSAKTSGASVDVTVTANVPSREEARELLAKVAERAQSNISSTVVRANDVVNKTLRQRMLAWFKKDK